MQIFIKLNSNCQIATKLLSNRVFTHFKGQFLVNSEKMKSKGAKEENGNILASFIELLGLKLLWVENSKRALKFVIHVLNCLMLCKSKFFFTGRQYRMLQNQEFMTDVRARCRENTYFQIFWIL